MSDDKVSLEFLGEQMLRMRGDMRELRSEQLQLRSEQVKLESEQTSMRADFRRLEGKVDGLDAKVDRHHSANQAEFKQMRETMALNLEVMLAAFNSRREGS